MRNVIRWLQFIGYVLETIGVLLYSISAGTLLGALGGLNLGILTGGFLIIVAVIVAALAVLKFKHIQGNVTCGVICAVFEFLVLIPAVAASVISLVNGGDAATLVGDIIGNVISMIIIIYAIPV